MKSISIISVILLFMPLASPLNGCQILENSSDGLTGKVMCGYQGWFRVPKDDSGCGWHHYSSGKSFLPNQCVIDAWPDVSELPEKDRFSTPFRHPDGKVAKVFSSTKKSTADLHFKWMKEYGIDGVFLQRFPVTTKNPVHRRAMNKVLKNVQTSANKYHRKWVLMYDLSGLKKGEMNLLIDDWKKLKSEFSLADKNHDPSYLYHRGKPLISLWGIGFKNRETSIEEWEKIVKYFKGQGFSVMLGVPTFWRTLTRDSINDPKLHKILAKADVLSPWTVGRYRNQETAKAYVKQTLTEDIKWCQKRSIDLLPVAFPGFSWQNLMRTRGKKAKLGSIPRQGGKFFWHQCWQYHKAGSQMLYVAMFDEVDEATAIMKLSTNPPNSEQAKFISEPDVPNDRYLWLAGVAGKCFGGEKVFPTDQAPTR